MCIPNTTTAQPAAALAGATWPATKPAYPPALVNLSVSASLPNPAKARLPPVRAGRRRWAEATRRLGDWTAGRSVCFALTSAARGASGSRSCHHIRLVGALGAPPKRMGGRALGQEEGGGLRRRAGWATGQQGGVCALRSPRQPVAQAEAGAVTISAWSVHSARRRSAREVVLWSTVPLSLHCTRDPQRRR